MPHSVCPSHSSPPLWFSPGCFNIFMSLRASLVAQMMKKLAAMQETKVRYPSGEDPLEKGMATHSSILAWRIPWTEELGRLQSMELRVRHD